MGTVVEEWNELEGKGLGEVSKMHDMCSLLRFRRLDFLKWRIESNRLWKVICS